MDKLSSVARPDKVEALKTLTTQAMFVYENEEKGGGSRYVVMPGNAVGNEAKRPDKLVVDFPNNFERDPEDINIFIEIMHTIPFPPVTQPEHVTAALAAAESLGVPLLQKDREQLEAAKIWGLSLGGQRINKEMGPKFCFGLAGDESMLSESELVSIYFPFLAGETNVLLCFYFNEVTGEWDYNTNDDSVFTANVGEEEGFVLFIEGWRGEKGGGEIEGGHKITHLTLTLQNTGSRHFTSAQADEIVVEEEKKESIEEEDVAVEGADDPRVQPSCNVRHAIASVDVRLMKSMQLTEVSLHHAHLFYLGLFFY